MRRLTPARKEAARARSAWKRSSVAIMFNLKLAAQTLCVAFEAQVAAVTVLPTRR